MKQQWLLMIGTVDLFILSLLDRIAYHYFLYWRYWWFDVPMHLLGGVAIGLVSSWSYLKLSHKQLIKASGFWSSLLMFNLAFAVAIGIIWEILELVSGRLIFFDGLDSLKDILVGTGGSLLSGFLISYLFLWRKTEITK